MGKKPEILFFFLTLVVLVSSMAYLDYIIPYQGSLQELFFAGRYVVFFTFLALLIFAAMVAPKAPHHFVRANIPLPVFLGAAAFGVGVLASAQLLDSVRLLTILSVLFAFCGLVAFLALKNHAELVTEERSDFEAKVLSILALPFVLPPIVSVGLFAVGHLLPLEILENKIYFRDGPGRWFLLNSSANGFGLDCAIGGFTMFMLSRLRIDRGWRWLSLAICLICLFSLYKSETRAAILFFLTAVGTYLVLSSEKTKIQGRKSLLLSSACLCLLALLFYVNQGDVLSYFRIGDDFGATSRRWLGVQGMMSVIILSPLQGIGFGGADLIPHEYPTNMMYLALAYEIGIVGLVGAVFCLFVPLILKFLSGHGDRGSHTTPIMCAWAVCIMTGYAIHQIFEFYLLRVSSSNLLFFLCWHLVMFGMRKR